MSYSSASQALCFGQSPTISTNANNTEALLHTLSSLLDEMCVRNDCALALAGSVRLTKFHSVARPGISILDYLSRIRRYSSCSDVCFIVALIYLDNCQNHSGLVVDSLNVHRLLVTSIMVASKFFDDKCQRNSLYAQIGGLATVELNQLEVELLNTLGFTLDVEPSQLHLYEQALLARFQRECPHQPIFGGFLLASAPSSTPSPMSPSSMQPESQFSPSSIQSQQPLSPLSSQSESSQPSAATSPHADSAFSSPTVRETLTAPFRQMVSC